MIKSLKFLGIACLIFLILIFGFNFYVVKGHEIYSIAENLPKSFYLKHVFKGQVKDFEKISDSWTDRHLILTVKNLEIDNDKFQSNINNTKIIIDLHNLFAGNYIETLHVNKGKVILKESIKKGEKTQFNFKKLKPYFNHFINSGVYLENLNIKRLPSDNFNSFDIFKKRYSQDIVLKHKNNLAVANILLSDNSISIINKINFDVEGSFSLIKDLQLNKTLKDTGYYKYFTANKNVYGEFIYTIDSDFRKKPLLKLFLNGNDLTIPYLNDFKINNVNGEIFYKDKDISTKNLTFNHSGSNAIGSLKTKDKVLSIALFIQPKVEEIEQIIGKSILNKILDFNEKIEIIINSHFKNSENDNVNIKTSFKNINLNKVGISDEIKDKAKIKYKVKSKTVKINSKFLNSFVDLKNEKYIFAFNENIDEKISKKEFDYIVTGSLNSFNLDTFINFINSEEEGSKHKNYYFNLRVNEVEFLNNKFKNVSIQTKGNEIEIIVNEENNNFKITTEKSFKTFFIKGDLLSYKDGKKEIEEKEIHFKNLFTKFDLKTINYNEKKLENIQGVLNSTLDKISLTDFEFQYREGKLGFDLEIINKKDSYSFKIYNNKEKFVSVKNLKNFLETNSVSSKSFTANVMLNFDTDKVFTIKRDTVNGIVSFNGEKILINKREGQDSIKFLKFLNLFNFENILKMISFNFKDYKEEGILFDNAWGQAEIRNGNILITDNIYFKGNLANIKISGNTDLIEEQFNLKATVITPTLKKASGLALLLASPQVAGAIWIFDKITGEKLNEITKSSFKIKGSFNEPEMK